MKHSQRLLLALFLTVLAIPCGAYYSSLSYFEQEALKTARDRAIFYKNTLDNALSRFEHLPFVLSHDPAIIATLSVGSSTFLNKRLESFAQEANIEAIYLMNPDGLTIASSNYAHPITFLGQSYGFRPYFKQAAAGERGKFYAIGATTSRPGFFIAEPVYDKNALVGVIAVKVDLSPLQEAWLLGNEAVFVANSDGVVVLSSDASWLYGTLRDIPPERQQAIEAQKQFNGEPLTSLAWRPRGDHYWELSDVDYLHVETPLPQMMWTLHYLADDSIVHERSLLTAVVATVVLSIALLGAVTLRSEQLRTALRISDEHRLRLENTNRDLERARSDLAKASKMAALGELSAAVTHELGQPISAMRNYLTAAEMSRSPESQAKTLSRLSAVVGRLEHAAQQLKSFARQENRPEQEVDLKDILAGAQLLLTHDITASQTRLNISAPAGPAPVLGDRLRLEQAVVNLMRNALAAMTDSDVRQLSVALSWSAMQASISVSDSGCGLGAQTLEELQEPFHTTRPSGEGMGLGLAIASSIVREHSGALTARNGDDGGAVFTITLPSAAAVSCNHAA
ncbi:MAG: sensor histidine kinase [Rhodobacteraceae bacterium]|nr:sensor histidine kinase [Paracoccaceae bacterium]